MAVPNSSMTGARILATRILPARIFAVLALAIMLATATVIVSPQPAGAQQEITYTATQVIPVPPASNYQGSGGGDGWDVALIDDRVYNVFHHLTRVTVACHLQSDASSCWPARTIVGPDGGFNSSSHSGLYMNQSDGKMYTYATQASDLTAGVVCIDTRSASDDMFCGYTPLTAEGDAFGGTVSGTSSIIELAGKLYAFNYYMASAQVGDRNTMMCYEIATGEACAGQPFSFDVGDAVFSTRTFPTPAVALIADQIIVPFETVTADQLACFDTSTASGCAGTWPATAPSGYASGAGAPFPVLSAAGATIGFCLPLGTDACYALDGTSIAAADGLVAAVPRTSQWSGEAVVLGTRVYVPNGVSNTVSCYDYAITSGCAGYPKSFSGLQLLYSVNADPARPSCLWVNSDGGASQIQNFDAFSGDGCGDGPIRVLAAASVVPTDLCRPATFTELNVLEPAPEEYSGATVEFLDGSGGLIGQPAQPLDATGALDLSPYGLDTVLGLPQFLITIDDAAAQQDEVTVELSWTGVLDASCIGDDTVTSGEEPPPVDDFACSVTMGAVSWTDSAQDLYWVYKSTDGGATNNWIGRTIGETTFTDPSPMVGAMYQVHYEGIDRTDCTIVADAAPFSCSVDAGFLTWADAGVDKYWIYRSTDDGATYDFAGRTFGATSKQDPMPAVGALYQVHYAGIPRIDCTVIAEPPATLLLNCVVDGDTLSWTDASQDKYWVYRSTDGGTTYVWIGRTLGDTTFTDPAPVEGGLYQVHYAGIPRRDCEPLA